MPIDRGVRPFRVRTEEHDGRLVLAMSGDLALESARVVIAALDRAGDAVRPEIVLDLRDLSFTGPGTARAAVTEEALARLRERRAPVGGGSGPVPAAQDADPARPRRRRRPPRFRSPRGWTTPGVI